MEILQMAAKNATSTTQKDQYALFCDASELTLLQTIVLMGVYGYILFIASNLISDGSELCLLVPSYAPLVGSVILPILGAVPDGVMVMFSGLGPKDVVQEEISVGVGTLAGSTVMLLTLPWTIGVVAGRVDYDGKKFNYKRPEDAPEDWEKLTPGNWSLGGCGVTFHDSIKENAKMMLITLIPFVIIMIPTVMIDEKPYKQEGKTWKKITKPASQISKEVNAEHMYSLVALAACVVLFCYYLYKEWVKSQEDEGEVGDKIAELNVQAMKDGTITLRGVMAQFRDNDWAKEKDLDKALDNPDALGEVRNMCKILAPFFASYDVNGDNEIDFDEFRMIFKDVHENLSRETQEKMFAAADVDNSKVINFEEFVACILCFALEAPVETEGTRPPKIMLDPKTFYAPEDEDQEEEDMPEDLADLSPEEQQRRIKQRAFSTMGLGTLLVVLFSDPAVDLLSRMGEILHVSPFYVSFLLSPMASNASELVAAANYAAKKTMKSMTTSLSTLEGAAVMNNTFTTGVFFALIYTRRIAWEFQAETIVLVLIQIAIAIMMLNTKHQLLYHACLVFSFYPLALAVTWLLENKLHMD